MSESADINRPGGVRDPVCGKPVDPLRARAVGIFAGVTHYFCSQACKAKFADPRRAAAEGAAASAAPGGVERRLPDASQADATGEWFTRGAAAPPPAAAPERFADLEPRIEPTKEARPSPSLVLELERAQKPRPWGLVAVVVLVALAAALFLGLR